MWWLAPTRDLIYSDLTAGRLDAALQDEVAASEGFLEATAGKEYAFCRSFREAIKIFWRRTGLAA